MRGDRRLAEVALKDAAAEACPRQPYIRSGGRSENAVEFDAAVAELKRLKLRECDRREALARWKLCHSLVDYQTVSGPYAPLVAV